MSQDYFVNVVNESPIPVTLGSDSITITGSVNVGSVVQVESTAEEPVHTHITEVGSSGILNVPYLPVGGTVTANQGNAPWEVTLDQSSSVPISLADTANLTAFSRLRVSEERLMGDYRYMYGEGTSIMMNDSSANGGTVTSDLNRNCALLSVTTASGSRYTRQTKKYHPYASGSNVLGMATFVMAPGKTNLVQAVGMYDDLNGIFFRMNGTTPQMVVRKGGVDTEVVNQANWNQNPLLNLDFTKTQILIVDYQWLGVGRIRIGFIHNGIPTYVHYFQHDNIATEVYLYQPSLPIRWEIYNSGVTASPSTMMVICAAVYGEGFTFVNSFTKSISTGNDTAGVSVSGTQGSTGVAVLAVRLKNVLAGKPNRSYNLLKSLSLFSTSDAHYRLVVLQDNTKFLTQPTWTDVPGYGWSEYAVGVNMAANWMSDGAYIVLKDNFVTGAGSGLGSTPTIAIDDNSLNAIYQNYDSSNSQIFAIIVDRIGTSNTTCRAAFEWLEIK